MNVCMLIRYTGCSEQKGREKVDCFNLHIAMKSSYSRDIATVLLYGYGCFTIN